MSMQMIEFQNADRRPLEELHLTLVTHGISEQFPALDRKWCIERCYMHYSPPPTPKQDGSFPIGAKEDWVSRVNGFNAGMAWLLQLEQYRFWSQMVFDEKSMDAVLSFLQEASPYYMMDDFPPYDDMLNLYREAQRLVFFVLKRLATHTESKTEFMSPKFLGRLIYDNYIFTVPIILDMCLMYGRDNRSQLHKIITTIFQVQPSYQQDLRKSISFTNMMLQNVEMKFTSRVEVDGELAKLSERTSDRLEDMPMKEFRDLVLYLLDCATNLSIFLDIHTPACTTFHQQLFEMRIVSLYENTIPAMYKKLETLLNRDDTQLLYFMLKHKLDVVRVEWLRAFRYILSSCINPIIENTDILTEMQLKTYVDDYMSVLSECLSEKTFMREYHTAYPVDSDLDLLSQFSLEVDEKKDYILEAVLACFDLPVQKKQRRLVECREKQRILDQQKEGAVLVNGSSKKKHVSGIECSSLITEVKDILPHLGDGYVEKCLEHYNFVSEDVVHAILENSLPLELISLDPALPRTPPDMSEVELLANTVERINVFDKDEFDIMTQDHIDTSRIHKGKRKGKHKDLIQLIDDKSHRAEFRDMYTKFGVFDTEGSLYDDEYDDTYDLVDVSVREAGEQERRPFVMPRVLRVKEESETSEDEVTEEEEVVKPTATPQDEFVQNPEDTRMKAEQKRRLKQEQSGGRRYHPTTPKDVVGRPKGQGQEAKVIVNRRNKSAQKSSRGNHNRRGGAQRKLQHGMVPS